MFYEKGNININLKGGISYEKKVHKYVISGSPGCRNTGRLW